MVAELLFIFVYLNHVPAFDPCSYDSKTGHGWCLAMSGHPAFDMLEVKDFASYDSVMEFIRKTGNAGHLIDLKTGKRSYISVKPVYKTISKEEQAVDHYEPVP